MRGEKVQPHHGGICGDGGLGAGLAPRWRASFATARGRIARSLGSTLNVVVFGLCWSFEWHRYDFAVRCNHHGKVRESQLGRIVKTKVMPDIFRYLASEVTAERHLPCEAISRYCPPAVSLDRRTNSCETFRRAGAYTIPKEKAPAQMGMSRGPRG